MYRVLYYTLSIIIVIVSASLSLSSTDAQNPEEGEIFAQAQILPGISLELRGGVNQRGKRTILQGGSVNFGNISFVEPEFITNGDAYFRERDLWLEAILEAKVVFNGAPAVDLAISKIYTGANQFSKVLYSEGLRQNDETKDIPNHPDTVALGTINNSGDDIKFRLIGVVTPDQIGSLIAKIQIGAEKQ